jgi:hypothetical protein
MSLPNEFVNGKDAGESNLSARMDVASNHTNEILHIERCQLFAERSICTNTLFNIIYIMHTLRFGWCLVNLAAGRPAKVLNISKQNA